MTTVSPFRSQLPTLRTVVVKIGSRIATAALNQSGGDCVKRIVRDIAALRTREIRVVLVSSGAIAHGMKALGLDVRPKSLPMKQACASIGQSRLMDTYARAFGRHKLCVGQVLLTWDDLRDKVRYLNLRNTLFQLLDCGAVPIVNENDSVGVEEINFGDNDTLGAQIALLIGAELYVIMTDVNGLYRSDPTADPNAEHVPLVERVTADVHILGSSATSAIGVGGMVTKLRAAETVTHAGLYALVGNGCTNGLLKTLTDADCGTLFLPSPGRMSSRRRWIAFARRSSGTVVVDEGAERAIVEKGKSLLAAGVKRLSGAFEPGDMVTIENEQGRVVGHGLTNYSADDLERIRGQRTARIAEELGGKRFDEVIHRDNLAVLVS